MAGKKVLIVYAHQEPKSFNGSLKRVAVEELSRQGLRRHRVRPVRHGLRAEGHEERHRWSRL